MFVITRGYLIGGAHIHIRDMAVTLVRDGHAVLVVTGGTGIFTDALDRAGISWVTCHHLQRAIHPVRDLIAVARLRTIIREFAPDLVSTHTSKAGLVGRLACYPDTIPCLFTAHGWAFTEGVQNSHRFAYRWIERLAAPLAERIVCVSEHDRLIGISAGMSPNRLVTILNGMPDIPDELRADPTGNDPVRVAMVARIDQQKDHQSLVEAFSGLRGACLDLVGDGPELAATRATVSRLNLDADVHFLGHRDDVAEVLARSHIFVLTSHWEGLPRSTLEAMRAGLPAIVSDVGGAGEAIVEGVTGYLVPRGDVAAVRDRLALLVGDAGLRAQMGRAARRRYEEAFTFDRMYAQTLDVYRMVLEDRGKWRSVESRRLHWET
jgi:glycosyltransferase involved in cell wall biosynthesis